MRKQLKQTRYHSKQWLPRANRAFFLPNSSLVLHLITEVKNTIALILIRISVGRSIQNEKRNAMWAARVTR